jgi:hypothetical protein
MDTDAKYLKRKVKAGRLDVHPTEKALVVNYELEATILGELGDPMLGERKECQKIIRLKSLNSQTDISALAKEVIHKCKLIHPSKVPEVEQLLYYLQNRKQVLPVNQSSSKTPSDNGSDAEAGGGSGSRVHSASLHRYSPVDDPSKISGPEEIANINNLDDYIELLYEEVSAKVRGSSLILQLARNPDNLEELSQNETLLGALSRVLREEWKVSIDLCTNIIYVFFCFSTFSQFHNIIARYKIGSLLMEIVDYEVKRYTQWSDDLATKQRKDASKAGNDEQRQNDLAKAEKRFNAFVGKQEQALRVSIYLLLNLSEDSKVEEKMTKKSIVGILAALLERKSHELLILVISFLKKISCYSRNKESMKTLNVVDKLAPLLATAQDNFDLVNATVRLLLNLSFDTELRSRMIKVGLLPKLVLLMKSCTDESEHPRSLNLQNSVCCVLYHLSIEDKIKSMFAYTDCIPIVMKMILETSDDQVSLEVMALGINLAANKRNAQLICEGHGLRVLMQRAFHYQDALVMKMIRNISQHDGTATKNLFIEFIGDIADAVQRADSPDFVVECVGILGNLTIPDLDFDRLLKEYDLVPWINTRLKHTRQPLGVEPHMDDLLLEVVVFLGTCAVDASAAQTIVKAGILDALIDLLKAKQEDDEIVLQVVYVFHQLCLHEESRGFIIKATDVVAYLTDLMHDKNPEVQRVCDATLDIISCNDDLWRERVRSEKFRFHNAQWLEIVGGHGQGLLASIEDDEFMDPDLAHGDSSCLVSSPLFDEDFEQLEPEDSDEDPDDIDDSHDILAGHFM